MTESDQVFKLGFWINNNSNKSLIIDPILIKLSWPKLNPLIFSCKISPNQDSPGMSSQQPPNVDITFTMGYRGFDVFNFLHVSEHSDHILFFFVGKN